MKHIRFIQMGPSNNALIYNLAASLDSIQNEFDFSFDEDVIPYPDDMNVKQPVTTRRLESLVATYATVNCPSEYPVGICDCPMESGLFGSYDEKVAVISTCNWVEKIQPYSVQSALAYVLADILLDLFLEIPVHQETRGCPSDFCEHIEDLKAGLSKCDYCYECRSRILRAVDQGQITLRQLAAIYKILDFVAGRKICFVLMPFRKEFNRIYTKYIKPTVADHGWLCTKADEIYEPRAIINIIWEQIIRADLIIADITGKNANVFYKLGYAHGVGKNTILITQVVNDAPFDLRHRQLVEYSPTLQGCKRLSEVIRRYL